MSGKVLCCLRKYYQFIFFSFSKDNVMKQALYLSRNQESLPNSNLTSHIGGIVFSWSKNSEHRSYDNYQCHVS